MGLMFGTDGIRGTANKYPIDCETLVNIGRAIASYFCENNDLVDKSSILMGCDTRISKDMVVNAVASGICSMGVDVVLAGVLSTPGIAYLTSVGSFRAGIAVSASHNEFCDNGIKIFNSKGCKLSSFAQIKLESIILNSNLREKSRSINKIGQIFHYKKPVEKYCKFLRNICYDDYSIEGVKIALDCSNGAMSSYAPSFFSGLGATVISLSCSPNGLNINNKCGSEYPETLAKTVLDKEADLGLAFDGDGDRLVAISELGDILTGDQLLAIFSNDLKKRGLLENDVVVSSIMSNLGLSIALERMKIQHVKSNLGDIQVSAKMTQVGSVLGGENSGHFIFSLNKIKIGDALLAGLKLVKNMKRYKSTLSELSKIIKLLPQCLLSVDISSRPNLTEIGYLQRTISAVEQKMGEKGRVFVRYSGTQKKCRIMVEGPESKEVKEDCHHIAKIVYEKTNPL